MLDDLAKQISEFARRASGRQPGQGDRDAHSGDHRQRRIFCLRRRRRHAASERGLVSRQADDRKRARRRRHRQSARPFARDHARQGAGRRVRAPDIPVKVR